MQATKGSVLSSISSGEMQDTSTNSRSPLFRLLPPEIHTQIGYYLSSQDLTNVVKTCHLGNKMYSYPLWTINGRSSFLKLPNIVHHRVAGFLRHVGPEPRRRYPIYILHRPSPDLLTSFVQLGKMAIVCKKTFLLYNRLLYDHLGNDINSTTECPESPGSWRRHLLARILMYRPLRPRCLERIFSRCNWEGNGRFLAEAMLGTIQEKGGHSSYHPVLRFLLNGLRRSTYPVPRPIQAHKQFIDMPILEQLCNYYVITRQVANLRVMRECGAFQATTIRDDGSRAFFGSFDQLLWHCVKYGDYRDELAFMLEVLREEAGADLNAPGLLDPPTLYWLVSETLSLRLHKGSSYDRPGLYSTHNALETSTTDWSLTARSVELNVVGTMKLLISVGADMTFTRFHPPPRIELPLSIMPTSLIKFRHWHDLYEFHALPQLVALGMPPAVFRELSFSHTYIYNKAYRSDHRLSAKTYRPSYLHRALNFPEFFNKATYITPLEYAQHIFRHTQDSEIDIPAGPDEDTALLTAVKMVVVKKHLASGLDEQLPPRFYAPQDFDVTDSNTEIQLYCIEELLRRGADPFKGNRRQESAAIVARDGGDLELLRRLFRGNEREMEWWVGWNISRLGIPRG
ncbi:hypothetical protein BJ508DRAFT_339532 [Ascobolus immersus RN42]|uniref:F-box domain-containing protein n=1 Tax=Ascobolus immersus RN42 TaxID=1160509 RepID=A0A3N4HR55_ASCIM|nr:hypothetical protein BJ508DRAFT_339532 [Ascobolus immersus RN42]